MFVGLSYGLGLKNSAFSKMINMDSMSIELDKNLGVMVSLTVVIVCHAVTAVSIFYDHEEDHKYHDYQGP